jgi:hypothetical protein
MRLTILIVLATTSWCAAANAQAWDNRYPVCLQIYGPVSYNECRYTSIEQCSISASGRGALCVANPYFANERPSPEYLQRRHRY